MKNKPVNVIFLHGLLGTKADWQPLIQELQRQGFENYIALDLPYHGERKHIEVQDFDDCCVNLHQQIQQVIGDSPFVLVGYSLGGRVALYYALKWLPKYQNSSLKGLVLEGANLGLASKTEQQARWKNDEFWAARFCSESPETVLNDWYKQPVFAHLGESQRLDLIRKRAPNCGENIGKMLLATSLAKQPDFTPQFLSKARLNLPICYIVGEHDKKFRQLAEQYPFTLEMIANTGHNAHLENPKAFSEILIKLLAVFR